MHPRDTLTVVSEYGLAWTSWRALYQVLSRTGRLQALFPAPGSIKALLAKAMDLPPSRLGERLAEAWDRERGTLCLSRDLESYTPHIGDPEAVVAEAEAAMRGKLLFFRRWECDLGSPPDWHRAAASEARWPDQRHWSRLSDLSPQWGDIKHVWEPSRFTHVYALVRAYALTADERYPEAFWSHFESWIVANQPELGPHWRCAQEMSIRCMAWIFGLYAFERCSASTPERIAALIQQLWYHARHIEKIHWYAAHCVRNNHTLSEAAGLFTMGTLFPFLPGASRWQQKGLKEFVDEAAWQVYDDGAYVQHSMNYARLAAQLITWTRSVARANRIPVAPPLLDRGRRLLDFLLAVQDPVSGRVPNYGSNDGALLFPLSAGDYLDYRPALNALSVVLDAKPLYQQGPWEEEAAWFAGSQAVEQCANRSVSSQVGSRSFAEGGYYTLHGNGTHALVRCASYRHRPLQADMLHLDIWYQGQNVLVDPGTFSYNLEPPWVEYFVGTASHNTVTVDSRDQMKRGPRFMWLDWTRARVLRFESHDNTVVFEGEQYGYRPVVHRRKVILREGLYLVLDHLVGGETEHTFRLHWLVNDFPLEVRDDGAVLQPPGEDGARLRLVMLSASGGRCTHARADEATPRGWQSLYYGERQPAWSLDLVAQGRGARFSTLLGPEERIAELLPLTVDGAADLAVTWEADEGGDRAVPDRFATRS